MYFLRVLLVLILLYKTRLSRLNFIVSFLFLNTSISSPSIDKIASLASSSLSLALNLFSISLKNFLNNVNSFIVFFLSEAFVNKDKKKKKDKEKEKEEENKNIEDIKKKVNKEKRF